MRRVRSPGSERASIGQITAAALNNVMNSRRLIADPRGPQGIVAAQTCTGKDPAHVRFGSEADICAAISHVRFTPNSDRESRHPQSVMSALPPKADICSATRDVRFGSKADIERLIRSPRRRGQVLSAEW